MSGGMGVFSYDGDYSGITEGEQQAEKTDRLLKNRLIGNSAESESFAGVVDSGNNQIPAHTDKMSLHSRP